MAIYPVNCVRSRCDDEVMVMTRYCALCAVRVGTDQLVLNFTLKGLLETTQATFTAHNRQEITFGVDFCCTCMKETSLKMIF